MQLFIYLIGSICLESARMQPTDERTNDSGAFVVGLAGARVGCQAEARC